MKPKNNILEAQDQYIQTGNEKYLVQFYEGLTAIGWTIQEKEQDVNKNPEAVLDIAGKVVLRLMEKRERIVRSAPSAYMKSALYFQNKTFFRDSIDDLDDDVCIDEEEDAPTYKECVDTILQSVSFPLDSEQGALVKATLEAQIDWHLVYRQLEDKKFRKQYRRNMNEVKQYAKDNLQSNRLLSVG